MDSLLNHYLKGLNEYETIDCEIKNPELVFGNLR